MDDDAVCDSLDITMMEPWTLPPPEVVASLAKQHLVGHVWHVVAHVPGHRWAFASPTGGMIVTDRPELHQAVLLQHLPDTNTPLQPHHAT